MYNVQRSQAGVKRPVFILGIDVGKGQNHWMIRTPDGRDHRQRPFPHTQAGYQTILAQITPWQRRYPTAEVLVALESTGPYGAPLLAWLADQPVSVVQVNPSHTHRVRELYDNSPHKTDQKDPHVVADIVALGRTFSVIQPQGAAAEIRHLRHARERAVGHRTAVQPQLVVVVFGLFPERLPVLGGMQTKTVQDLLRTDGTPQAVAAHSVATLTRRLRRVSRGRYGSQEAVALWTAARTSVGRTAGQASSVQESRHLLALWTTLTQQITAYETALQAQVARCPASQYLFSIPGVGLVTVAGLLEEIGDFARFPTAAAMEKLAGLNLYEVSSGQHRGQQHVSKRGRALLRKVWSFGALNTVREGQAFHAKYQA